MDFDLKYDHHEPDFALGLQSVRAALPDHEVQALTPLSGGYCNTNYALELASGERCVLRVGGRGAETLALECALLRRLQGRLPVPEVLYLELTGGPIGRPHALVSLLAGEPLCRVENNLPGAAVHGLGKQIGALAAQLHAERFASSGFFAVGAAGELTLPDPVPSIRAAYDGLTRKCLATPALQERLGPELAEELAHRCARHGDSVWSSLEQGRLTHSDFNQKNILVAELQGRWHVTGLLDFEFAHAGSGLDDLGNFLRFSEEQPDYAPALAEGYRAAGGSLPERWRFCTRYLDLVPLMQMLARPSPGPKTIATVRGAIAAHLAALAEAEA